MKTEIRKEAQKIFDRTIYLTLGIIFFVWLIGSIAKMMPKAHAQVIESDIISSWNLMDTKPTTRWRLNSNWLSQRYIPLTGNRIERMERLLNTYDLDWKKLYPAIQTIARIHSIKPEAIICIAYADSSLWKYLKTANNFGNVGNNDRWDTVDYANIEKWWNAIGKTLNNKYLSYIYTIDYLSRYHNKTGKIYASSEENQFINMANCLGMLNESNTGVVDNFQFRF
jgi:hypothetical protein